MHGGGGPWHESIQGTDSAELGTPYIAPDTYSVLEVAPIIFVRGLMHT